MKVLILSGGLGARISEETDLKPKSMVEIGGSPIPWLIMKIHSHYVFNDFIILTGYKHEGFWRDMDILRDKIELTNM